MAATVIDRSVENKNKNDKRTKGTSAKLVPLSATRSPGKDPGTLGIDGPTSFVAMATAAGRFCESITRPRVSLTSVRVCVLPSFFLLGFGFWRWLPSFRSSSYLEVIELHFDVLETPTRFRRQIVVGRHGDRAQRNGKTHENPKEEEEEEEEEEEVTQRNDADRVSEDTAAPSASNGRRGRPGTAPKKKEEKKGTLTEPLRAWPSTSIGPLAVANE